MDPATTAAPPPQSSDARLQAITEQLEWLIARQERSEEMWNELMPVGRRAMTSLAGRLDEAEKKGWLDFGREALGVAERVLEHYSAEDVRRLGEAIIPILDTVRSLTQPSVMTVAAGAAGAVEHPGKPVSLFGAMRATRDDDVQRGLGIVLDVLRRLGRSAPGSASDQGAERRARLAKAVAPRRLPAAAPTRPVPPPAACAVPKPAVAATVVDGVAFTADGYLTDATQWTRGMAETLAAGQGIALTDAHWKVLEAARGDFAATRASPNIRRLTQVQPLGTKELYGLFPRAPGRAIAKIAGLPKPAGCL